MRMRADGTLSQNWRHNSKHGWPLSHNGYEWYTWYKACVKCFCTLKSMLRNNNNSLIQLLNCSVDARSGYIYMLSVSVGMLVFRNISFVILTTSNEILEQLLWVGINYLDGIWPLPHYNDVTMSKIASQITSLTIVYSTVYSGPDQTKHQSSASLAFVRGTGEFPAQMASNAENVSIWWRHHDHVWC